LSHVNRIKPIRFALSRRPDITLWFENMLKKQPKPTIILDTQKTTIEQQEQNIFSKSMTATSPNQNIPTSSLPINNFPDQSSTDVFQSLTVNTLIELKNSLEYSRLKNEKNEEKKEPGFAKLPSHCQQMILNASAPSPYTDPATVPTEFFAAAPAEKSAFKAKLLIDHKLNSANVKRFKISPALAASIWIADLISDDITPSNLSIWFFPERSHTESKESNLEKGLWMLDGKHIRADIPLLSKTTVYVPDGVMDAYFMVFNFRALCQLLFGQDCELSVFLTEWLDHIFNNRELYIIQQEDNKTFLAQVLQCINQSTHLYLDSCSKHLRSDVRDHLLNHENHRELIEHRNFTHRLPKAIQDIFASNSVKEEKYKDTKKGGGNQGGGNGKRKFEEDQEKLRKRVDNKIKELQKFKLKPNESFQPYYERQKECPKFKEGILCMKFLLKGHCHANCKRIHNLSKEHIEKFQKFYSEVKESIREMDFPERAAE